jgi:hypothetical protein
MYSSLPDEQNGTKLTANLYKPASMQVYCKIYIRQFDNLEGLNCKLDKEIRLSIVILFVGKLVDLLHRNHRPSPAWFEQYRTGVLAQSAAVRCHRQNPWCGEPHKVVVLAGAASFGRSRPCRAPAWSRHLDKRLNWPRARAPAYLGSALGGAQVCWSCDVPAIGGLAVGSDSVALRERSAVHGSSLHVGPIRLAREEERRRVGQ